MSLLSSLKRLYALQTLDLRFVTSSKAPPSDPARPQPLADGKSKETGLPAGAQPALWTTPELLGYIVVVAIAVPMMINSVYQVSKPSHPNYENFEPELEEGWILGRKVDNSDSQYSTFRENVPYLLALTVVHPLLRKMYNTIFPASTSTQGTQPPTKESADARKKQRISFDFGFAIVFLAALHGFSALKIFLILYLNYSIAKNAPRNSLVAATWIFNIGILFANELGAGYPFEKITQAFVPWEDAKDNWGTILDSYGGLVPRWEILFNLTVLRLISFNLDYHWSSQKLGSNSLEKKQLDPSNLSERDRVDISANPEDYSLRNYMAYALYSPLYLTGPILTFNDYISQQKYKLRSITFERTFLYGLRFLLSLLTMEVMIHFTYSVAISKAKPAWEVYSPFQLSMLGYFNLHHIWLKLLLPWRCSRLWSLVDSVDPPENMVRCMSNNYSALAFWRGWHRSFNRWIIRYIYIPMGGSGATTSRGAFGKVRVVANYLAVFTFVALWHDINLRLLMWGWLIVLFIAPEVLATMAFPAKKWKDRPTQYRILCGIGAVGNILMMMAANLVGFAIGLDGLKGLLEGIVGSFSGVLYMVTASFVLYTGAQLMFEIREEEKRHGIKMAC